MAATTVAFDILFGTADHEMDALEIQINTSQYLKQQHQAAQAVLEIFQIHEAILLTKMARLFRFQRFMHLHLLAEIFR